MYLSVMALQQHFGNASCSAEVPIYLEWWVGIEQVGILAAFDMADIFIGNLPKAETEIYALYADMAGITVEQIKEMEFGTLPLMIYDSFHGVKNTSFFKVLSRLL